MQGKPTGFIAVLSPKLIIALFPKVIRNTYSSLTRKSKGSSAIDSGRGVAPGRIPINLQGPTNTNPYGLCELYQSRS